MPHGEGSFSLGSFIITINVKPTSPMDPNTKGSVPGFAMRDVGMQYSRIRLSRHSSSMDGVSDSYIISAFEVL